MDQSTESKGPTGKGKRQGQAKPPAPNVFGLKAQSIEALCRKIIKAPEWGQASAALSRAYGSSKAEGEGELLWGLLRQGHLPWDEAVPKLLPLLRATVGYATSADLLALLSTRTVLKGSSPLIKLWPADMDAIAMYAYSLDGTGIEAVFGKLPPRVQRGLQLVRARFGTLPAPRGASPGPARLAEELRSEVVTSLLTGDFPDRVVAFKDGALHAAEIAENRADFDLIVTALFGSSEAFVGESLAALLADADRAEDDQTYGLYTPGYTWGPFVAACNIASLEQLGRLLGHTRAASLGLSALRTLLIDDLGLGADPILSLSLPGSLRSSCERTGDRMQARLVLMAALAAHQAGTVLPADADARLAPFWGLTEEDNRVAVEALVTLPPERVRAILEVSLAEHGRYAAPLVAALPIPELLERAMRLWLCAEPFASMAYALASVRDVAVLGAPLLPVLLREHQRRVREGSSELEQEILRWAMVFTLARVARAGGPIEPAWDDLLHLRGLEPELPGHVLQDLIEAIVEVLPALPAERSGALIRAAFAPGHPRSPWAIRLLAGTFSAELWAHGFEVLAALTAVDPTTHEALHYAHQTLLAPRLIPLLRRHGRPLLDGPLGEQLKSSLSWMFEVDRRPDVQS